jgi:hypothetical protein
MDKNLWLVFQHRVFVGILKANLLFLMKGNHLLEKIFRFSLIKLIILILFKKKSNSLMQ